MHQTLKSIWNKLSSGPRFISVYGEPWNKQTNLKINGYEARYITTSAAIVALASLPASGALTAIFTSAAFVAGSAMTTGLYRILESGVTKPHFTALSKMAIDSEGRAMPHKDTVKLLDFTKIIYVKTRAAGIGFTVCTLVTEAFWNPVHKISTGVSQIYNQIATGQTAAAASTIGVGMAVSAIALPFIKTRFYKKILDGKYVFCEPPAPETQRQTSGYGRPLPQGQGFVPLPVPAKAY